MKVLVTGASGMLGGATARALAERGDDVTVLQRRPAGLGLREVQADVADPDAVLRAVDGHEASDHSALVRYYEKIANTQVRAGGAQE